MGAMTEHTYLGELEQRVLWAVLRMGGDGYGTTILEELNARLDRVVSPGALYATLDRLEQKGMIRSRLEDGDPKRGGRRKRYMAVTAEGRTALERVREEWKRLWAGMDPAVGAHEP
jgi:DNA-binding PadR family transcriptional regulator